MGSAFSHHSGGSGGSGSKPSTTAAQSSNNNAHRVTDLDRAILQLKTQRRQLEGAANRASRLAERERATAVEAVSAGDKRSALTALRRRKLHEKRLETVDNYLSNVESVLAGIDDAKAAAAVSSALRSGANALKSLHALAPLSEVESILKDTAAAKEYEESMAALLETSEGKLDAAQEAAAEAELEEMMMAVKGASEGGAEKATATSTAEAKEEKQIEEDELPEVPKHDVAKKEEEALPSVPSSIAVAAVEGKVREKEKERELVAA